MMMASDEQQQLPVIEVADSDEIAPGSAENVAAAASAAAVVAPTSRRNNNRNSNNLVVSIAGHAIRQSVGLLTWCGHAIGEPMDVRPRRENGNNENSNAHSAAAAGTGSGVANLAGSAGAEGGTGAGAAIKAAGAARAAAATEEAAARTDGEGEEETKESDEEPQESEEESEETQPKNNNAPNPTMVSGSRSSNRMDPLSLLGFAICLGVAFIAGFRVTFDAGKVSTPTRATFAVSVDGRNVPATTTGAWSLATSSVVGGTSSPQRTYNFYVCECDHRSKNMGTKKSMRLPSSPPAATPPTPPHQLSTAGRGANSLVAPLAGQADKLASAFFFLLTGGRSGNSDSGGGDDDGGSDRNDNDSGGVQAEIGFGAFKPWTEQGKAAAEALLDGPWV